MNELLPLIKYCIFGFFVTLIISPFIISFIKREKVGQVILNYVDSHSSKSGTPTMGGIIFIISISIVALICFNKESNLAKFSILIFIAYGIVGFLDDFIKFKFKRNLGLTPIQKIIFQLAISISIGFYVYYSGAVGSILIIPFSKFSIDVGWWIIPIVAIIYLATTNSVNLTDGLDGLASATTFSYMLCFSIILLLFMQTNLAGHSEISLNEISNLTTLCSVVCGAMLSFLVFNCFPAKVFMGDTGSLALGSLVASVAVFSRMSLFIPILGIMFVLSSVSVIVQVAYYKLTKKRIFLMAPLHHHFERKGVHEVRITMCYALITFFVGAIVVMFTIF